MGQSAADILASAKAELAKADGLSKSVDKELPKPPPAPASHPAPYAAARKARPSGIKGEAAETGASIKANMENARKALQ